MATSTVNIDLNALNAEVEKLSPEEIREQLLQLRVKQKVQQKKYHNTDAAKAYRQKRANTFKLMAERAKALGIYDEIKAKANELADAKLAEEAAEGDATDEAA